MQEVIIALFTPIVIMIVMFMIAERFMYACKNVIEFVKSLL